MISAREPQWEPAIQVCGLTKTYQSARRDVVAVDHVDLTIDDGEWVAIVGPSGCGKSTLLNLLAGLDSPDGGSIRVHGVELAGLSAGRLAAWRGQHVGIVFQFFQLMPTLTAMENVLLPLELAGRRGGRRARAHELLTRVGLADLADHLPSELSGGEQQRVAIARALANEPRLLLADEPTGNLDSVTGRSIVELFAQLAAAGTTIIMVTHDRSVAGRASRIVAMQDGRVIDERSRLADLDRAFAFSGQIDADAAP